MVPRVCPVLAALLIFVSGQHSIAWKSDVGGWFVGVDRSLGYGCYMQSYPDDGFLLRLGFDADGRSLHFRIVVRIGSHW